MASVAHRIGFTTGILILPQRQTALVAKQAATLDVLSSGRLRLGVGLGWNEVEYISLNQDFHTRGRRLEEQVALLRQLWTQPLVSFTGRWHSIPDAGINPLPVQRPIPIWFGGRRRACAALHHRHRKSPQRRGHGTPGALAAGRSQDLTHRRLPPPGTHPRLLGSWCSVTQGKWVVWVGLLRNPTQTTHQIHCDGPMDLTLGKDKPLRM